MAVSLTEKIRLSFLLRNDILLTRNIYIEEALRLVFTTELHAEDMQYGMHSNHVSHKVFHGDS